MINSPGILWLIGLLGVSLIGFSGQACTSENLKSCEVEVSPNKGFRLQVTQQDSLTDDNPAIKAGDSNTIQ